MAAAAIAASTSPLSISVRGVDGLARSAVSMFAEVGQRRHRLPAHLQLRRRLDRVLLALGDDADEIADPDHGDQPRNIAHRSFVDRDQAGADKRAGIDAGIGRPHHAAVQHAGHAHVVDIDEFAGRLRRQVDARHRLPDDAVGADGLDRHVVGEFEADGFARYQFAIADAAVVLAADQAVFDREILDRQLEPFSRARDQKLPRLRRRLAQRHRRDLDGFAGDGRALVGHDSGVAEHDDDARKGHVEFFGDDLAERGADAGAEIDMAVIGGDRAVGCDLDEGLEARRRPTGRTTDSDPCGR